MKTAKPLAIPEIRDYVVYYPSGNILNLTGNFSNAVISGEIVPCLSRVPPDSDVIVLDPRVVVTRKEGLVWEPRMPSWKYGKAQWVVAWLKEHPEWPPFDLRIDVEGIKTIEKAIMARQFR